MLIVVFVSIGVIKLFLDVNWFNLKPEVTSIMLGYNNFWQIMSNMDYFRSGLESPFIHLWYMAILMQFDLVFPFIFLLLKKIGDKINRIIPITITLVISLLGGAYFYYAHLDDYPSHLQKGDRIDAGDLLGMMGDTGYGTEGTRGKFPVHRHIGIAVKTKDQVEFWINPYALLKYTEDK